MASSPGSEGGEIAYDPWACRFEVGPANRFPTPTSGLRKKSLAISGEQNQQQMKKVAECTNERCDISERGSAEH